jgi:CheY-like chemotaxis protein
LPLADPRAIAGDDKPVGLDQLDRSGGARILIVDDNRDSADSMAAILQVLGHEVRVAYDSGTALTLAGSFAPERALLDIGLPDMDGYELARQLKALPACTSLALFAVTGYGQEEDRRRAVAAGFDRYFTKPLDIAELAAAIDAECESAP